MRRIDYPAWRGVTLLAGVMLLIGAVVLPASFRRAAAQETDAAALLDRAATAMATVQSFHFVVTTPQGKSLITDQIELTGIEGDIQRPDRFQASFTASASIISLTVRVIGIGGQLWVTNPMQSGDNWVEVTDGSESDELPIPELLNPDKLLLAVVDLIETPAVTGEEEIDGRTTTRIEGIFDPRKVSGAAGTPVPDELSELTGETPIPVILWIDADGRVPRVQFAGPLTAADSGDVIRQIDLTKFDEPVTIEPPAA